MSLGSPNRKNSTILLPPTSTLPDIASTNLKLSESLGHRLLGYIPPQTKEPSLDNLPSYSPAELKALSVNKIYRKLLTSSTFFNSYSFCKAVLPPNLDLTLTKHAVQLSVLLQLLAVNYFLM